MIHPRRQATCVGDAAPYSMCREVEAACVSTGRRATRDSARRSASGSGRRAAAAPRPCATTRRLFPHLLRGAVRARHLPPTRASIPPARPQPHPMRGVCGRSMVVMIKQRGTVGGGAEARGALRLRPFAPSISLRSLLCSSLLAPISPRMAFSSIPGPVPGCGAALLRGTSRHALPDPPGSRASPYPRPAAMLPPSLPPH